jgi:hypothetical protein
MQYRGECWGGNSYGKYGKRPDSECNMKCKKDNSRFCGGSWRNNVFKLVKIAKKEFKYTALYGETWLGCYKDARNRDLPTLIRAGYGNPSKCFKMAQDQGF